jgi:heme/copper-type cytochrome/quinol oxidase subunit 3
MTSETMTNNIHGDKEGGSSGVAAYGGESQTLTPLLASSVNKALLGMLLFIGTEVMFFGGLISTFLILQAGAVAWPPPNQPRLPVEVTGINTFILLLSGYTMHRALRAIRQDHLHAMIKWLVVTAVFGAIFLAVQGYEWIGLVSYGLTFTSSVYGGTFYTLIGFHGLHVLGALIFLLYVLIRAIGRKYSLQEHTGVALCGVYWYFVVGIWPVLYVLVYLS